MINIREKLRKKLYLEEIEGSDFLLCPGCVTKPDDAIHRNDLEMILKEKGLIFPDSLIDFLWASWYAFSSLGNCR